MIMRKGSIVTTCESTRGVITDYDAGYASVLVQLTDGPSLDDLDRSHGRWYGLSEVTDTGKIDDQAWVW
ncbi:MAG: hypothetical protein ABR585_12590, partial [Gemmatimonadaceae bacterium]